MRRPHKLTATLEDLAEVFGPDRRVAVCRELTKLHEEVRRTTLGEAAQWYAANPPRGEFVLVVEGAVPAVREAAPRRRAGPGGGAPGPGAPPESRRPAGRR